MANRRLAIHIGWTFFPPSEDYSKQAGYRRAGAFRFFVEKCLPCGFGTVLCRFIKKQVDSVCVCCTDSIGFKWRFRNAVRFVPAVMPSKDLAQSWHRPIIQYSWKSQRMRFSSTPIFHCIQSMRILIRTSSDSQKILETNRIVSQRIQLHTRLKKVRWRQSVVQSLAYYRTQSKYWGSRLGSVSNTCASLLGCVLVQ